MSFVVHNYGRTPAFNVRTTVSSIETVYGKQPYTFPSFSDAPGVLSESTLVPNTEFTAIGPDYVVVELTHDHIALFVHAELTLRAWAEITYDDAFTPPGHHVIQSCAVYSREVDSFATCPSECRVN